MQEAAQKEGLLYRLYNIDFDQAKAGREGWFLFPWCAARALACCLHAADAVGAAMVLFGHAASLHANAEGVCLSEAACTPLPCILRPHALVTDYRTPCSVRVRACIPLRHPSRASEVDSNWFAPCSNTSVQLPVQRAEAERFAGQGADRAVAQDRAARRSGRAGRRAAPRRLGAHQSAQSYTHTAVDLEPGSGCRLMAMMATWPAMALVAVGISVSSSNASTMQCAGWRRPYCRSPDRVL